MEQYEVYEEIKDKKHHICICKEFKVAIYVAKCLAFCDAKGDTYYVGLPEDDVLRMVVGGGWYVSIRKDLKTGKLIRADLE